MKETGMFCSGKSEWSGHGHGVAYIKIIWWQGVSEVNLSGNISTDCFHEL